MLIVKSKQSNWSPITPYEPSYTYNICSINLHNLKPIPANTSHFEKSFFPSAIKLWNSLPSNAKSTPSISEFKFHTPYWLYNKSFNLY